MSDLQLGGTGSKVAPGMEVVIEAGTKYEIMDNKGEVLVLDPRERPEVVNFLHAFDSWVLVDNQFPKGNDIVRGAWGKVCDAWAQIPMSLAKDFPSVKGGTVSMPAPERNPGIAEL